MARGRLGWFLTGAACALPLLSIWMSPAFPPGLKLLAGLLLALCAAAPVSGLSLLALAGPLALPLRHWVGAPAIGGSEMLELLVLPALAGLCVGRGLRPSRVPGLTHGAAWILGTACAASALVVLSVHPAIAASADGGADLLWTHLTRDYFTDPRALPAWHDAAIWIESLALAALVSHEIRGHQEAGPRLARFALIGFAAEALFSWDRLAQIALRDPAPLAAVVQHLMSTRISPHVPDINAMGSMFALAAAGWLTWLIAPSVSRRWRLTTFLGALLSVGALWMTHSRAAILSALVVVVVAWIRLRRPSLRTIAAGVAAGAVVVAGALAFNVLQVSQAPASTAATIRLELARIGLRIAADHPLFGVGLGEFQRQARGHTSRELIAIFPVSRVGENAHNQLVQVLGELGLVGLTAFCAYWVGLLGPLASRARTWRAPTPLVACAAGLIAFLLSSMLGHPLLTPLATLTTFFVAGVVRGLTPSDAAAPTGWRRRIAAACMLAIVVSIPFRIAEARRRVDLDNVVTGASPTAGDLDGVQYRMADAHSVWWIRADALVVEIPLRADQGDGCVVSVAVDGLAADEVRVTADQWQRLRFTFQERETRRTTRRIDLRTSTETCGLLVGRPIVTG